MDAANERSRRYLLGDVSDGRMCVIGGRNVVKGEENSGDDLREEEKQQS
jgi:hypothetical protein